MNLNFNDNSFWEVAINFRWPHEGFMFGYEIIPPGGACNYTTVVLHLSLFSIIIEWGEVE